MPENELIDGAVKAIDAADAVLKWTRQKLIEAQEENRKLKRIIMELTEMTDGTDT